MSSHTHPQTPLGRAPAHCPGQQHRTEREAFKAAASAQLTLGNPGPVSCSPWLAMKDLSGANFCPKL